jgi:hypothetical protein
MLQVQLSRNEGAPGQAVEAQVRSADPGAIAQVRLVVDEGGEGFDWALQRSGDVWTIAASVPYESAPGTYSLAFRAYGKDARLVDSSQVSFTVL